MQYRLRRSEGVIMNVYDFDNTIYRGDSTVGLIFYCWRVRPKSLLNLPRTAVLGLLYAVHILPKLTFKENLYHMFSYIPDMEKVVDAYVSSHLDHIKPWYLQQQEPDDLIISASPEFLVKAFAGKIGIQHVIASKVDIHTGRYSGLNCHGEEKVAQFYRLYPAGRISRFYSDSRSDLPLARLAEEAFLVHGDQRTDWGSR
jgi:HAD superfamily phosphoserine phosphatase-like hydrolase